VKRTMLFAALAVAGLNAHAGALCFVDHMASGADRGSSWSDAYLQLQSALNDTSCKEIWVAKGVYKAGVFDPSETFSVGPNVALYGGFSAGDATREMRDWQLNKTVLSGDVDDDDAVDADGIDQSSSGLLGYNSYHIVTMSDDGTANITANTVLDGFYITGGDASGVPNGIGAGVSCIATGVDAECSPTLRNLVLVGNKAGGGAAISLRGELGGKSSPLIDNAVFRNNVADFGGALESSSYMGRTEPTIARSTFEGNAGRSGGVVNTAQSGGIANPTFTDCVFRDNGGGGGAQDGAAIYTSVYYGSDAHVTLHNVLLQNNISADLGGAVYVYAESASASLAMDNVSAIYNTSRQGGALALDAVDSQISASIINSTFAGNAAHNGAGIFADGQSEGIGSSVTIETKNSTFTQNSAFDDAVPGNGGAIYLGSDGLDGGASSLAAMNSIFYGDKVSAGGSGAEVFVGPFATATINHSVIDGGCPTHATCDHATSADPLLGPLGFYFGSTPVVRPAPTGSATDFGDDATCTLVDQRGIPRTWGRHCDAGSVELRLPSDDVSNPSGF
jgi:hypothetical protein